MSRTNRISFGLGRSTGAALLVFGMLWCLAFSAACSRDKDDGTQPRAVEQLPELILNDDTPDLLLTWLDERGRTHSGVKLGEVPEKSRELVRVVTPKAGHGQLFYVADLRKKDAAARYAVRSMSRAEWEGLIDQRRQAYRAKHAPPVTTSSADLPPLAPGGLQAIVYGAVWCKPCHQAVSHLKKRGVKVVEYDIEKQPRRATEMRGKLKAAGRSGGTIPVIDLAGTILVGFSGRAVDQAILAAKRRQTHL